MRLLLLPPILILLSFLNFPPETFGISCHACNFLSEKDQAKVQKIMGQSAKARAARGRSWNLNRTFNSTPTSTTAEPKRNLTTVTTTLPPLNTTQAGVVVEDKSRRRKRQDSEPEQANPEQANPGETGAEPATDSGGGGDPYLTHFLELGKRPCPKDDVKIVESEDASNSSTVLDCEPLRGFKKQLKFTTRNEFEFVCGKVTKQDGTVSKMCVDFGPVNRTARIPSDRLGCGTTKPMKDGEKDVDPGTIGCMCNTELCNGASKSGWSFRIAVTVIAVAVLVPGAMR